jgi:hypothetical protein
VVPNRLVLNKSTNYAEFRVTNTGNDTTTYLINPKQYRMLRDGGFEETLIPDPDQYFASDYLMYFPRRLTLGPGQFETIEVRVLNRDSLLEGEYRSHLNIRTEVKKAIANIVTIDAHGVTAALVPSFGVTIPVIVRAGDLNVDVTISDLAFIQDSTGPKLEFSLNRVGNMSVYGDIVIEHISPKMVATKVANVRGVAVYTPNNLRCVVVKLDKGLSYSNGSLRVTYTAQYEDGTIITESELMLKDKKLHTSRRATNTKGRGASR